MVQAPSRSRSPRRSSTARSRRSSGSTEWVASNSLLSMSPETNWLAAPVVLNSTIQSMTSPTYLGGHLDVVIQAAELAPFPPAVGGVALGLAVIPQRTLEAALAATGANPPSPIPLPWSDAEGDWPWLRFCYVSALGMDQTVAATNHSDLSVVRFHDVARSKRRLSEDDALVLVTELVGTGSFPVQGVFCLSVTTRLLLRQA